MSSGDFILVKIEDVEDPTMIYMCRVQKETTEALIGSVMNTGSTMNTTEAVSAWIGKSNRQAGFRPALANFVWDAGSAPANYTGKGGRIPLFTQAAYKAAIVEGATGTYLGKMINITSVTKQSVV